MSLSDEKSNAELKAELKQLFTSGKCPDIDELNDAYFDEILQGSLVRAPPIPEPDFGKLRNRAKGL